jgi:hypothetical protein
MVRRSIGWVYILSSLGVVVLRRRVLRGFTIALLFVSIVSVDRVVGLVGVTGGELEVDVDRVFEGVVLVDRAEGVDGSGNARG